MQKYLIKEEIQWKFNLIRAPWWDGQFERKVGLVKQFLYKTIGRANLSQNKFEEIVLDIEVTLNNRPLMYLEEDIQMSVLTPNTLLYRQPLLVPEEDLDEVPEIKRRQRYINKCKDAAWTRWWKEYLKVLKERHNMLHQAKEMKISSSDIVLIRGDEKQAIKGQIWRDKCSGVENIKIVYGTSYSILVPTHVHEQILSARNCCHKFIKNVLPEKRKENV